MKNKYCYQQLSYLIIIFLLSTTNLGAQENDCNYKKPHQADQWIFGNKARLDFTQSSPVASQTNINPNLTTYGISSISDDNGNLLMVSNGMTVWNKYLSVMANGSGLLGSAGASQSSIIVPHPGNDKQYIIFTIDIYFPPPVSRGDGVNYSVIDFTTNNLGNVISKNNLLFKEKLKTKFVLLNMKNNSDYG